ncbi:unnamed protein product [Rodentolepis nana]|uniref:Drf_GBD domain-containing protein n=1 Tax=Rodentolepis nana TaxID=102285 RepID=A0A0R3TU06_RODNA|nr:unnamed protein product [Rodentolepis nana]
MGPKIRNTRANPNALLEDLRLTKQNVLQRNPPPTTPYTNDASAVGSTFWSTSNSNKFADVKRPSRTSSSFPRRPLQENLTKLDSIINDLDDLDGSTDAYESHVVFSIVRLAAAYDVVKLKFQKLIMFSIFATCTFSDCI